MISQDTRVTRYFLGGGSEITFHLVLPFCRFCAASANRRPKGLLSWLLVYSLIFGSFALALILLDQAQGDSLIGSHPLVIAAAFAAASLVAILALFRPSGLQSSYFQPVRIFKLRREFLSGAIKGIGFFFTQPRYAAAFQRLNQVAISTGDIFVKGS